MNGWINGSIDGKWMDRQIELVTRHFLVVQTTDIENGPVCDNRSIDPAISLLILGSKVTIIGQVKPADIAPGGLNLIENKILIVAFIWLTQSE